MKLKILLPTHILLDEDVAKITAEAENGSFGLLPKHIDFVAALVPGILSYEPEAGSDVFVAIDQGILVKCGAEVLVSTRQAVRGESLETLEQAVMEQFQALDQRQKRTRSAIARLEADFMRRLTEKGGR